ncbi:hypothetical protein [Lysinibacillus fusiformis]|uniref:hypothetical protein n=1 Tax=Lysinibacillus fusiformis TaxID=28031 RepID=UPI0020D04694|nr:hypothetical protein [Lysinibacillus fusiformis]
MTIYSGIFNSVNGDRKYNAWWFAKYFATFIGNGVFPNPSSNLQVAAYQNMKVVVKPGSGWIDGYFIYSDGDHVLSLDVADGVLKRIDRVVMRLNHLTRKIEIVVKKGTFASSPVAPTLQRDTDAYELALADVLINNGATQITQANITDQRLNSTLCGIVHGTVNQVDTTTIFNQYQAWFNDIKGSVAGELDIWQDAQEQEFLTWFESIKDILDGDVAANLAARIANLEQGLASHMAEVSHIKWIETIGGTANALTATIDGLTSYKNGLAVSFPVNSNSTAAMTLNINGLGVIPIKKANGAAFSNAKVNGVYTVRYRAGAFILQGESEVEVGRQIITPSTVNQAITQGVHDGTGYVIGSPNLLPKNIAKDINIFGVYCTAMVFPPLTPGTTIIGGTFKLTQSSWTEYYLAKSIYPKVSGKITLVFDLSRYGGSSGDSAAARIMKNNVQIGEYQYRTESTFPTFYSLDIDVSPSDTIQIQIMSYVSRAYAQNSVVLICVAGVPPLASFINV